MTRCCLIPVLLALVAAGPVVAADPPKPADRKEEILKRFMEELVLLTPGTGKFPAAFRMGSRGDAPDAEKPEHEVTFKYSFAVAKYEVTQELYAATTGNDPSRWRGPRNSVEKVSWEEANTFCQKLTAELRRLKLLKDDEVIRLPTEAEWEYVCRAGTTTAYSFGDRADDLGDYAWFRGNSKGEDPPVGKKKPNPWGLYDMHGYIWEWCLDAWEPSYKDAPADGSARDSKGAKQRVIRGGSWADGADQSRSAYRQPADAGRLSDAIGFRCVRVTEGGKK